MPPLSRKVFFVCLFGFALLQLYGICYTELRLQYEASSDMIWFSGTGYHTPMYRYAFILNKFLLFPAFWFHLPMKVVATVYCINDAMFYLTIALLIIALTARYDYAASVLAAPVLIHGSNFYWIVNEVFLSGSLLVLYSAVSKYMDDGPFKKALLPLCMFFIIWSHPVMILVLIVFLPFIYPSLTDIKRSLPILVFIGANVLLRLFVLSGYDRDQLDRMEGRWFELRYWLELSWGCLIEYSALAVMITVALYAVARSKNKIQYFSKINRIFIITIKIEFRIIFRHLVHNLLLFLTNILNHPFNRKNQRQICIRHWIIWWVYRNYHLIIYDYAVIHMII